MSLTNIDNLIRALNSAKLDVHATVKDIKSETALRNKLEGYISLCKELQTATESRTKLHFELARKLQDLQQLKTAPELRDATMMEPHQVAKYQLSFKRIQQEADILVSRLKIANLL